MDTIEITKQTKAMIDGLKTICATFGLGNAASEYKIITEVFLYKYLNDKFLWQMRNVESALKDKSDAEVEDYLAGLADDAFTLLLYQLSADTARLQRNQLISTLFNRQYEEKFHELFDQTLKDISEQNLDVFSVSAGTSSRIKLFGGLSQYVIEEEKKDPFCRALIQQLVSASFSPVFDQKYDFFADVFEYLIKDYNKDSGKYAKYYTPHSIATILARILVQGDVQDVSVYDPAAGSGTLVLATAHAIGENRCTIYTQDISQKSNEFLRLNLILNNLVHSLPNVIHDDTLVSPRHLNARGDGIATFDYIVSNPPFNTDFSDTRDKLAGDAYKSRFFAGVPVTPPKDKESMAVYLLFVQHIIVSLSENGRAAIVVPTTFLSKKSKIEKAIRETLIDNKLLKGIITMPSNLFATTTTSVSVLFLHNDHKEKSVVLVDASALGEKYKDGKNQRIYLRDFEIQQIINTFKEEVCLDDFSSVVSYETIKREAYSFKIRQYFNFKYEKHNYTPEEYNSVLYQYKAQYQTLFNLDAICSNAIRAMFDYWFIQYKFPDRNGKPYALNSGEFDYDIRMKDYVPKGWEVKRLDEICDILLGGTPDTDIKQYWDGDIPWLSSGEIAQFPIRHSDKYITELGMAESATAFAKKGAILLSITRYIRASVLAIDACFNQSVVAVIPNKRLPTVFLLPFIESKVPLYMSLRTGAQQPHINKGTVEETLVAVPPQEIVNAYVDSTKRIYNDILTTTKEKAASISLSDFEMPDILSMQ